MAKFMDKVIGIMGFAEDNDDDYTEMEDNAEVNEEKEEAPRPSGRKNGQVLSLHTQKPMRVVVMEPTSFEEAQNIADQLKSRRPVIVNLESTDKALAKRIVDFVSGTTYALNGNMQKVGMGIFLFVPSNVDISGELKDDIRMGKGMFWPASK